MKKITWITGHYFLDSDTPILNQFNEKNSFLINWHIIITKGRKANYDLNNLFVQNNVTINLLKFKRSIFSFFTFLQLFIFVFKIKREKADYYYINCEVDPYLPFLLKLFISKSKIIFAIHDVIPHVGSMKLKSKFVKYKLTNFDNIHVFSREQEKIINRQFKENKNRKIFYIPFALKHFGFSSLKPPTNYIQFLFFGKIRKNKGLEYLIKAGNLLQKTHNGQFKIKIVGHCNNWNYYEKLITEKKAFELSIEQYPNDKIPDLFCSSHYLILPYLDVTQSGPLYIALNYQIPFVASNLDGFKIFFETQEIGYLFEKENVTSLYNCLVEIIENKDLKYEKLKLNINKFKEEICSIDKIITYYIRMFNSLVVN